MYHNTLQNDYYVSLLLKTISIQNDYNVMYTTIPLPNDRVLYNYDIYTTKPLQCTIYYNVQKWLQCTIYHQMMTMYCMYKTVLYTWLIFDNIGYYIMTTIQCILYYNKW